MTIRKKQTHKTETFLMESRGVRLHRNQVSRPAVNIDEDDQEYILFICVPGMERKDFEITINKGVLTIKASQPSTVRCYRDRCEYSFQEWKRSFLLPPDADVILSQANYQNGELMIHIPKGYANEIKEEMVIHVY